MRCLLKTMFLKSSKKILIIGCFGLLLPAGAATAHAQAGDSSIPADTKSLTRYLDRQSGMTADEATAFALNNNPELSALRKEADAARSLIRQARLRANPSLDANGTKQIGGADNTLMVQAMLPLELGGRRSARVAVAERELIVREKAVADRERILAGEVRLKFGEAIAQAFKLMLVENLLDTAIRGFQLVQARVVEGRTPPLEESITQVEVNRLRSTRETEAGKTEIAFLELRNLLGMSPEDPLRLRGDFSGLTAQTAPLSQATVEALRNRPDLAVVRAMEDLSTARIEQARAEGRLDASVSAGYQRMNFSFPLNGITDAGTLRPIQDIFHSFTFGITLQLPVRNRNQGAIEAAVANRDAAQKRREFAELVVRREVAAAYARYESTARAMEIFRVGVRGQASANLDVVRQTYELGARNLIEYLVEERRFIELENQFVDAQLAVYQARVEILRAVSAPELTGK